MESWRKKLTEIGKGSRMTTSATASPDTRPIFNDDVVRLFTLATIFWGVVGFLVGLVIALQLAFPDLNIAPYLNFGRLRPLHTSAVIFAFGGNALFASSYYIVQRTCRARLWGGWLPAFTFFGP